MTTAALPRPREAERSRRRRTWIAFAVLAAGTTAFWWSFDLVAADVLRVTSRTSSPGGGETISTVGGLFTGWECALRYRPAWPANIGLAVAPALWLSALWLRSAWALTIGAALCALGTAVQAMCAFTGPSEGVTQFLGGYWLWLASSIVMTAGFALLPAPERPPPGEALPREVVITARTRFALAFAALGTVFAGTSLFAFEGVRGATAVLLPASATAATRAQLTPSTFTLALERPVASVVALVLLALPALFAAAWLLRSTFVRVCGATLATAVVAAQPFVPHDGFWNSWFSALHPGLVHWHASPAALLIAFMLLPTGRRGT